MSSAKWMSAAFGFFWLLAHHRGLKSLGLVMALGTACIYLATVVVLRPVLKWRLERDSVVTQSARPQLGIAAAAVEP